MSYIVDQNSNSFPMLFLFKEKRMKLAKIEEISLQGEHVHQGSSHLFFHYDETKTFWQVFSHLSTEALFLKIVSLEFSILYNNFSFEIISRPPRPAHMRHPEKNFDFFCPIIKNVHNSCQWREYVKLLSNLADYWKKFEASTTTTFQNHLRV